MQKSSELHERDVVASPSSDKNLNELSWRVALRAAAKSLSQDRWRIGDLLLEGEAAGFQSYREAVEETGLPEASLANMKSLARTFPPSHRCERLSWSHHAEVASLSTDRRKQLLDAAAAGGWSRRRLHSEALEVRAPSSTAVPILQRPVVLPEARSLPVVQYQIDIAEVRAATIAPAEHAIEQPASGTSHEALASFRSGLSELLKLYGAGLGPTVSHHARAALAAADREMMRGSGTPATSEAFGRPH
jgi:hypothetical protein